MILKLWKEVEGRSGEKWREVERSREKWREADIRGVASLLCGQVAFLPQRMSMRS